MDVLINSTAHLDAFIQLNEQWIQRYFSLEQADLELAKNPYKIIEEGGYIFTLVDAQQVVGVCALFNQGDDVFELARMAVSPNYQGQGLSHHLMNACLSTLHTVKAREVYLLSNTLLSAAIALYKKYGFITSQRGIDPQYSRANIVMHHYLYPTTTHSL